MTRFTRILALLVVLGVVFAAPAKVMASMVEHAECHDCEHSSDEGAQEETGNTCGGDHECPCACHVQVAVAVVVAPAPVNGPHILVLDRLVTGDAMPVEGPVPGIDYPPQNA